MPLHTRSIAVSVTVICFFGVAIIGWLSGRSPFTCGKRAVIAAVVVYIVASLAVKAINAILINAMIADQMRRSQQKEGNSGSKD